MAKLGILLLLAIHGVSCGMGHSPHPLVPYHQESLLHTVVRSGSREILNSMLKQGYYSINLQDKNGRTALMEAAIKGSAEIVELLLSYDADITLEDVAGETALSYAESHNNNDSHKAVIELLHDRADILFMNCSDNAALDR